MGSEDSVHICANYPSLGDQLCLIGAARLYARRSPEKEVFVSALPKVVNAYGDSLVRSGQTGRRVVLDPAKRHRVKHESPCLNYLGTFAADLGLAFESPPNLELPSLGPPTGLLPQAYIALQLGGNIG